MYNWKNITEKDWRVLLLDWNRTDIFTFDPKNVPASSIRYSSSGWCLPPLKLSNANSAHLLIISWGWRSWYPYQLLGTLPAVVEVYYSCRCLPSYQLLEAITAIVDSSTSAVEVCFSNAYLIISCKSYPNCWWFQHLSCWGMFQIAPYQLLESVSSARDHGTFFFFFFERVSQLLVPTSGSAVAGCSSCWLSPWSHHTPAKPLPLAHLLCKENNQCASLQEYAKQLRCKLKKITSYLCKYLNLKPENAI